MKKLKVALVGFGYWGPHISRNLAKINTAEIAYICDLSEKNLQLARNIFPLTKTVKNIEPILTDETVEAVIIATPTNSHYDIAKSFLLSGKNVLVEKPFTGNIKHAKELQAISERNKKILMVSFPFIYSEPIKKVKEELIRSSLGNLYYYDSTRVNLGLIKNDSDVISDLAIHDVSILKFLFQKNPISVLAVGESYIGKQTEIAYIHLMYADGFSANINVSWLSPLKNRTIVLAGKKKMLLYNDVEPSEKIKIFSKSIKITKTRLNPFAPLYRSGDVYIPYLEQTEPLQTMLEHFLKCIRSGKSPLSSAKFGIEVLEIVNAAHKSLHDRKEVRL